MSSEIRSGSAKFKNKKHLLIELSNVCGLSSAQIYQISKKLSTMLEMIELEEFALEKFGVILRESNDIKPKPQQTSRFQFCNDI